MSPSSHLPFALLLACALSLPLVLAGCAAQDGPSGGGATPPADAASTREETRSFDIPAGRAIEYKLDMREGAPLAFSWSATRPVSYDFHGDTGGDAFTSHKKGTALTDQDDDWSAPFAGRHGWYWKNNNQQPVTLTLTTRGEYDVVGLV